MQKIRCCVRKLVQCNFLVVQSLFKFCKSVVNLSVFSLLRDPLSSCCVLYHFHVVDCFFVFEQLDQVKDVGMWVLYVFLQLTVPAFQVVGSSWTVRHMHCTQWKKQPFALIPGKRSLMVTSQSKKIVLGCSCS